MPKIDPSTVFSTFDWDQLAKIPQQHCWQERLKISKVAKFENHLFKTNRRLYGGGEGVGGGGGGYGTFVPPPYKDVKISQL